MCSENKSESVVFKGLIQNTEVFKKSFKKEFKNKIRKFYKEFQDFINAFIDRLKSKSPDETQITEETVLKEAKLFKEAYLKICEEEKGGM